MKAVLVYSSDIWGLKAKAQNKIYIFSRSFIKYILGVKSSTDTNSLYGEIGQYPLSVDLSVNVLTFFHRLSNMSSDRLVKIVFDEMMRLDGLGYKSL